jgi:hypothetical protein
MGLHVFFGCYFNLFRLMAKCGVLENLLLKEHTHTFCNNDGDVRELDFRFFVGGQKIGAPFHGESSSSSNGGGSSSGGMMMRVLKRVRPSPRPSWSRLTSWAGSQ